MIPFGHDEDTKEGLRVVILGFYFGFDWINVKRGYFSG
jgi:hypothetical protein